MLAFFYRTPEHLKATLEKIAQLNAALMPEAERRYEELKGKLDPPTFREWETLRAAHAIERSMLSTVIGIISDSSTGPLILNLPWIIVDLRSASRSLLVGDNPAILMPLNLEMGHLAIPVGPHHLFVASRNTALLADLSRTPPSLLVREVNRLQVERATNLVIATDRSQAAFARKYFGTCRIGSLATGLRQPARAFAEIKDRL